MATEASAREVCPNCLKLKGHTTRNNLVVLDNVKVCMACNYKESIRKSFNLIPGKIVSLAKRNISYETCEKFNVRVTEFTGKLSGKGRELNRELITIFPIYKDGRVIQQKIKCQDDKHEQGIKGDSKCRNLFGMNLFEPSSKLPIIITEGEEDAMSMYQATGYPTVSITRGANAAKSQLIDNLEWLQRFKEVILCFDNDAPGRDAVSDCVSLFEPGKLRSAILPLKDANEMLLAGRENEIKLCLFRAETIKPNTITFPTDIREKILIKPSYGVSWPWKFMDTVTYGCRLGEVYMLGGDTGAGKAQPIDSLVSTPHGWESINSLYEGCYIHDMNGKECIVKGIYDKGVKKVYKFTFEDGRQCEACSSHLWRLYDEEVVDTKELIKRIENHEDVFIPNVFVIDYEEKNYKILPEILGLLLGKQGFIDKRELDNLCVKSYIQYGSRINYNTFKDVLGNLNQDFSFTEIPHYYMLGGHLQRYKLLAAIISSAENDNDNNYWKDDSFFMDNIDSKKGESIRDLARSLGFLSTLFKYNEYNSLRIDIAINPKIKLINIEYSRKIRCKCISISSPTHCYITNNFIVTHNTQLAYGIVSNWLSEGCKVGLFDFERQNEQTMQRLIGEQLNKRIYLPDSDWFNEDEISKKIDEIGQNIALYNPSSGKLTMDNVLSTIRYLNKGYHVNYFVIDNLKMLAVSAIKDMKDFEFASHAVGKLVQIAKELNIFILILNHLIKDNIKYSANVTDTTGDVSTNISGLSWESGRMPEVGHLFGGGNVAALPDYVMLIARNKVSSDFNESRILRVRFAKTRFKSGYEGEEFNLVYDDETGKLYQKWS